MGKDLLANLFTPGGAVIGTLLLLAAGYAGPGIKQGLQGAAEFWRARLGRNGNGRAKQGDPAGGELRKDLRALGPAPPEEVAIVRAALEALEQRVTGEGGLQERLAIVESTCARTEVKVDALPAKFAEEVRKQRTEERRDVTIGAARLMMHALRRYGVMPERRVGPQTTRPPGRERRHDDPESG